MLVIVDYNVGNLRSIHKSIERVGVEAVISNDIDLIRNASKLILPGVGHFDYAMNNLRNSGIKEVLDYKALIDKTPILGICLGMQLMTQYSEEGDIEGLNWIEAKTKRFQMDLKVPHIGWNVSTKISENEFTTGVSVSDEFYYVHSYYVETKNKKLNMFETNYCHNFVSGFRKDNIYGVQFHPEKSYNQGLQLLKNFSKL